MKSFGLFLNRNVVFGEDSLNKTIVPKFINEKIQSIALITSKSVGRLAEVQSFLNSLEAAHIQFRNWVISGEPTYLDIDYIVSQARDFNFDWIVAIGGGSVMDSGKAISMMLKEEGSIKEFLEGVGGKKPSGNKIPFIAVPTTAGTGSEATKNGVICGTKEELFKRSFRHDNFVPDLAVIDPLLAVSCPFGVTAASGMDAVTQLIESFISIKANPVTDSLAESGLISIAESFEAVLMDGSDLNARSGMAYAAWCSGVCLGNADLGLVHGIAGVLGAYIHIPHGVACGILLPVVIEAIIRKLIVEAPMGSQKFGYLVKVARVGYLLSGELESGFDIAEGCRKLMEILKVWSEKVRLGNLTDYGFDISNTKFIAEKSSNRKSPVIFSHDEIIDIINSCC